MQSTQIEMLGRAWLTGQLVRAGIDLARPDRDASADLIAYPPDFSWFCPVQLKTITGEGITLWQKYVGKPLALVYVFLGTADGGLGRRRESRAFVMNPAEAWDLPRRCQRSHDVVHHDTYRFNAVTAALHEQLQPYAVSDDRWPERLSSIAAGG